MLPGPQQLREFALAAAERLGFAAAGVAGVEPAPQLAAFPGWIAAGRAGEMQYLSRRGADGRFLREEIGLVWPWARSVLCAALSYHTAQPRSTECAGGEFQDRGWISRYAWGDDYHDVLRRRLQQWAGQLGDYAGRAATFQAVVDTAPLVERAAAAQAGVGWLGKNTCLIHPKAGSYLFLGSVLTSLELSPDQPQPDRCGSCRRCIEACPTAALTPYEMDARRCLAYLNIELRGSIPEALRAPMGNNVLGCDICQDVCPWNRKAPAGAEAAFQPRPGLVAPPLEELAAMSIDDYRRRFRRSAVKRAKFSGWQRNLAVAMGNSGNPEFRSRLETWAGGDAPLLAEHAAWALARLRPAEAAHDTAMDFTLSSKAFGGGQPIPAEHSCAGDNTSPQLRWEGTPSGTRSLALHMHDPDAPHPGGFDHWLVYDLPATITELPSGKYDGAQFPLGGLAGKNGRGELGYTGPCPPPGPPHRYCFTLFALREPSLELKPGATRAELKQAMAGKVLAQAQLVGTFRR